MKCLGPAVLTGLMVRECQHFVDTVDRLPSMRDLAVTAPTGQARHAGHLVPIVSTGRLDERPWSKTPNRRGCADFAPAPDGGKESGLGWAERCETARTENQYLDPYFCSIRCLAQNNRIFQGVIRIF
ncbi:hypothetical protein [Acidiphilium sp. PM]|uniref:hypothetical protein n=1 Tax=Acidiphilium sp. PM TaxID=1043206 RepID=UPI0002144D41|nr:hypothetical protein [Acidiphilium sp. PM]EGO93343.1 hypothetical protein APM_0280 [Acidiphilium sp. PM]